MAHLSHFRISVAAALILVMAAAVPAAAATTATLGDGVSVEQTLTVVVGSSGVFYQKSSRTTMEPGETSAEQGVGITVGGNSPWKLTVSGTDLTAGSNAIPAWERTVRIDSISGPTMVLTTPSSLSNGMTLATADSGSFGLSTWWALTVPGDQPSGDYTGQLTFTVALQ